MKTGKLIISLDYELIWGVYQRKDISRYIKENIESANLIVEKIADLAAQYGIKITIGFVGILYDKSIVDNFFNGKNSKENVPQSIDAVKKIYDSLTDESLRKKIFGDPEVLARLQQQNHIQLVSHTSFHTFYLQSNNLEQDLKLEHYTSREILKNMGIRCDTIIFPRNQYNSKILMSYKNEGIKFFRGIDFGDHWVKVGLIKKLKNKGEKLYYLLRLYFGRPMDTTYTVNDQEMPINVKGSHFFRPFSKTLGSFFENQKLKSLKKQMTHAAKKRRIVHIWWHPHNFGKNMDENFNQLEELFKTYKTLNKDYDLTSIWMNEIGNQ